MQHSHEPKWLHIIANCFPKYIPNEKKKKNEEKKTNHQNIISVEHLVHGRLEAATRYQTNGKKLPILRAR